MTMAGNRSLASKCRMLAPLALVLWCLLTPVACMTPSRAIKGSDEAGMRLATEFWQRQTGQTNTSFNVNRPLDVLTLRIALLAATRDEEGVVFPILGDVGRLSVSNQVLVLSLKEALCVAARNDRAYQTHKEDVFLKALDLDYQQYQFETTFTGLLLGALAGDPSLEELSGKARVGAARKWESGLAVASSLALDVVSLLRDDWRSLGLTGDLTMSLPLLRGSGREIIREPLTQAERNLTDAILSFEYYRQTYAVTVASAYFDVLEFMQRLENSRENERRLAENCRRAEMMFEAGLMKRIEVDQARTELLMAGEGVISMRRSYESKLDSFKIRIGLPPEARVNLRQEELVQLEDQIAHWSSTGQDATKGFPEEAEAFEIALAERRDLMVVRNRILDQERVVNIAADALRADVTLTGGGALERRRSTGQGSFRGGETTHGSLQISMPWDRRRERNDYKRQLVLFDQAKRSLEEQEDLVKQSVRNGYRNLRAAHATYVNQTEAMKVAKLRVESNNLFQQAGRADMRDILEAEGAMLRARNEFCSAIIQWWRSELELRRDLGVLEVSDAGELQRFDGENNG